MERILVRTLVSHASGPVEPGSDRRRSRIYESDVGGGFAAGGTGESARPTPAVFDTPGRFRRRFPRQADPAQAVRRTTAGSRSHPRDVAARSPGGCLGLTSMTFSIPNQAVLTVLGESSIPLPLGVDRDSNWRRGASVAGMLEITLVGKPASGTGSTTAAIGRTRWRDSRRISMWESWRLRPGREVRQRSSAWYGQI